MRHFLLKFAAVCVLLANGPLATAATISRDQADALERKVDTIARPAPAGRQTSVTQDEVNSWLVFRRERLPAGVTSPQVALLGAGRVSGQAVVDLEVIGRRRASGGLFDPWSLLGGRVPVVVVGTLRSRNGIGQFEMESATLGGVPVPRTIVEELVNAFSRSTEQPGGVRLEQPFVLPSRIKQVTVGRGDVVVVQ